MKSSLSKEPECLCDFSRGAWGIHNKNCDWKANKGVANRQNTVNNKISSSTCMHSWEAFKYPTGDTSVFRKACRYCRVVGCAACNKDEPDQHCTISNHLPSHLFPSPNGMPLPLDYKILG